MIKEKSLPRYTRIAMDIAEAILNEEYPVGTKISGRSNLAGKYQVSPETIRKAIALLKDYEVVSSSPRSGIRILNANNAAQFIKDIASSNDNETLKDEIKTLLKEKNQLDQKINDRIDRFLEISHRPKHIANFYPYELALCKGARLVNQTISESRFWYHTGATILMVKRKGKAYLSPGPDFKFKTHDILVFICNSEDYNRTRSFINDIGDES
jgi:K+/H+ antiporter YhaU regulatory subunit KhtT